MNVGISRVDARNVDGVGRRILGYHLHDAHCAARVPSALVQQRLLIALGRDHQVIEVLLAGILFEELKVPWNFFISSAEVEFLTHLVFCR